MTMNIDFETKKAVMDLLRKLNPSVAFGTFRAKADSLEWCGSVNGSSLKLPEGWKYSKAKGRIIGPKFDFFYWKEHRYQLQS